MTPETEVLSELLAHAARGDAQAQDLLFKQIGSLLIKAVRNKRRSKYPNATDKHEVEDLTQQVAIRMLQSLPSHEFRGRRAFTAWIYKLADRELIDQLRHDRAEKRQVDETDIGGKALPALVRTLESQVDAQRETTELRRKLEELPDNYATAVWLHHLGYSHEEVGEVLCTSAEAARKLVARGRAKLVRG